MATFTETKLQIDSSQISVVEKYAGFEFPIEYKKHLLKYNGGRCTPNVFKFNENGKDTDSCVDWFLAIYDGKYHNLRYYIEIYKIEEKRLPFHILPIAHDPGGNLICISCDTKDKGCIYFWDHEKEVDYSISDDTDYSNMYLVAESLDRFLDDLYDGY